jgi:TIMELESS-interacting protein
MSFDLYTDFNEELDAQAGDYEEDDNREGSPRPDDENGDPEDPADPEKVEPKLKVVKVKKKQVTLNAERLKGPRGIIAVEDFYTNMKFRGKGYEKQDLDDVMKRLEHWAHRWDNRDFLV